MTHQTCSDLFRKCSEFTTADEVKAMGIYPYFQPISSELGDEVVIDGHHLLMIGSNNYLGLVNDTRVKEAAADAVRKYGSGCTGSRFLNGTIDLHLQLEERLAKFIGMQSALVFSTGFQANLAAISCLVEKNDVLIIDRADHASIVDGCRLSYGKAIKFKHNDMEDLERILINVSHRANCNGAMIIVDGVFSMEGDLAPLPEITKLATRYGAKLMVDDAHAIGVVGKNGSGTPSHFGVSDSVDIVVGTFSKSFASLGGFVAADEVIINYIKHMGRALIFSASIPPSNAAAALKALEIMESEPERREKLWENTHKMHRELRLLVFDIGATETPVVPILIGQDMEAFSFWRKLYDNGVFANAIISPATPPGRALIRTSYTATHTDEQLDRVLSVLKKVGQEMGVI